MAAGLTGRAKGEARLKIGYFQLIGGASGDMILGALIDAGAPFDQMRAALETLNLKGISLSRRSARRGGVTGTFVRVEFPEGARMTRWQEFEDVVERSSLPPRVVERALSVFRRLAEAEATAHRTAIEETHLHELGELDTLVDVVGSVVGLELLGIERLYASAFPTGSGVVRSAHGVLPVPSPATAALLASANAPVVKPLSGQAETGEMVTPTGAAILTTLASFHHPSMNLERVGYGLGTRESPDYPNVLALWVGRESDSELVTGVSMIETNVDDSTAEVLGYVQERLLKLGALDVWFTPIQMKKNRPGTMMSAIVPMDLEKEAVDVVMRETSTLGVRVRPLTRYEAAREIVEVETSLGPVEVKVKGLGGERVAVFPEYEACRRIAVERGMALQQVYRTVAREAEAIILGS